MGLFMEELAKRLYQNKIKISFLGIKSSDGMEKIKKLLRFAD